MNSNGSSFRVKMFSLSHEPGCKILPISMRANGVTYGTPEGDEFIKREVEIQAKAGWNLVAVMPSEAGERVNLKFTDVKKRVFSCQLIAHVFGDFTEQKLIDKLSRLNIVVELIDDFEIKESEITE